MKMWLVHVVVWMVGDMAIHVKEIHQKQIIAHLSDAETKQAILEYVLKQHNVGDTEYKHRTFITMNTQSTRIDYEGRCEITIELGSDTNETTATKTTATSSEET